MVIAVETSLEKKNTWANVTVLQQLLFLLAQLNYILLKYIAEEARLRMTDRITIKVIEGIIMLL